MKIKNLFWAALSVTAAFTFASCSSDNEVTETEVPVVQQTKLEIPYAISVGTSSTTRATVDADKSTLRFAAGDKLYITGENIKGVLSFDPESKYIGETFVESDNVFSGTLEYSGMGTPDENLELTATLVSAQQNEGTEISVDAAGTVTVNYPTTLCTSLNEAVQKYSKLTAAFPLGAYPVNSNHTIMLTQQTAFLDFVITFEDGTTSGTTLSAKVKNGSNNYTADVTTTTENSKVVAKFVLPVAGGTVLSGATVQMGSKDAFDITNATLAGNRVYNIKRKYSDPDDLGSSDYNAYIVLPLTLKATSDGTIKISHPQVGMKYSKNGGTKVSATTNDDIEISVVAGDKVQVYGNGTSITHYYDASTTLYTNIAGGTATCKVYGNVMSLVDEADFATNTTLPATYTFNRLFHSNTTLTDASYLVLPATTLVNYSYGRMFEGCTSLTTAPVLPATTLAERCYNKMFLGCTSLTKAPILPAETLAKGCYNSMFLDCTNLNSVTCLATKINASSCTTDWLSGVAATGTFTKAASMTSWSSGASGIPSGWTVADYVAP